MADDDADDCLLVRESLAKTGLRHEFIAVGNGEELLAYLRHEQPNAARPDLILLDLNMPKKDGRETLRELRAAEAWRAIPVVVLTTSMAEDDIKACYTAGANSFVTKPSTYREWIEWIDVLAHYWFGVVRLPQNE